MAGAYDFGVIIIMLINIAITIDKTHNIYDLIYAASTFMFCKYSHGDKTFSWFAHELFMLLRKYEYFVDKNMFWFT